MTTPFKKLILMSGVMASGKSTERERLVDRIFRNTGEKPLVLHPDDAHMVDGRYCYTEAGRDRAWDSCYRQLAAWASNPRSGPSHCIFDGTFLESDRRRALVSIGKGLGLDVECMYLDTPLLVCLERNLTRSEDRRIPDKVISAAHARQSFPSPAEGFDRVFCLKTHLLPKRESVYLEVVLGADGKVNYRDTGLAIEEDGIRRVRKPAEHETGCKGLCRGCCP